MSQGRGAAKSAVAAWVGLDWSEGTQEVCLQVEGSTKVERMEVGGEAEQLQAWLGELRQRFGGRKVAICLEKFRGGLLYALMACEFVLVYAVNPQSMAKYRKVFKVSGAKDDPLDATLLLDLLRKHRERLQVLEPGDEASRRLYLLCEGRRRLVDERTRLGQQVRSLLKSYYPQALRWAGSLDQRWAGKFLKRWPSLQRLQQARAQSREGWYARESGRPRQWRRHLEQIAKAEALTDDEAVVSTSVLRLSALVAQVQELSKAIETYDQQIAKQWAAHVDREQFDSFPGAGPVLAPRLSAVFGSQRRRFEDASELQQLSGIAPVTKRSGKSIRVVRRYACSKFLLQTFHEYAGCSIPFSRWAKAYYEQQRERGAGHHAAVRALAYKWMRILYRCWKDRTRYDEDKYIQALTKRNSPLAARLQSIPA